MASTPKISNLEDARQCVEEARQMQARVRSMWSNARESLREIQNVRADLREQIEDLARRDGFRRQLTTTLLSKILDSAIDSTGADMGNIQLFDSHSGQLLIHVQRGFDAPFLDFFNSVHVGQAACGSALKAAKRVIVPDVAHSPIFPRSDCLEVMLDAGARAVQSTPLIAKSGRILGMLSTHYRTVNQPARKDLRLIDFFAERAAEILEEERRLAHLNGHNGHNSHATETAFAATPTFEKSCVRVVPFSQKD